MSVAKISGVSPLFSRILPATMALLFAVAGAGCGGPTPQAMCSGATRSLSTDVAPIIVSRCSGGEICHAAFGGPSQMHARLVGVAADRQPTGCTPDPLVTPGDPARSYLVNKLLGVGMCPGTQRMPLGEPLSADDIQAITDWICAGAADD